MLEKLIESITLKASIKLELNEHEQNDKYIESLTIDCDNKEVVKECLCEVEEYLLHNDIINEINNEFKKIEYYTSKNSSTTIHLLSFCSYNSCPLIRLLSIRSLLIGSLQGSSGFSPQVETGSWYSLWYDSSIKLTGFFGTTSQELVAIEKRIESEINKRLALNNTNYFAFRISNGVFSEPYILKISNGKIQEVICSTSGHTSTNLHSYLWQFIKKNNSECKINSTLPLKHNGDCTRYADYALIQFQYLSETHGTDQAFSLLSKNKPYKANEKTFRDFQMVSWFLGYDLIKKILYPLPEDIAHQISAQEAQRKAEPDERYQRAHAEGVIKKHVQQIRQFPGAFNNASTVIKAQEQHAALHRQLDDFLASRQSEVSKALATLKISETHSPIAQAIAAKRQDIDAQAQQLETQINEELRQRREVNARQHVRQSPTDNYIPSKGSRSNVSKAHIELDGSHVSKAAESQQAVEPLSSQYKPKACRLEEKELQQGPNETSEITATVAKPFNKIAHRTIIAEGGRIVVTRKEDLIYIDEMAAKSTGNGYGRAIMRDLITEALFDSKKIGLSADFSSHTFHLYMGMIPIDIEIDYITHTYGVTGKRCIKELTKCKALDDLNILDSSTQKYLLDFLENEVKDVEITLNEVIKHRDFLLSLDTKKVSSLKQRFIPDFIEALEQGVGDSYPDTSSLGSVEMVLSQQGVIRWKEAIDNVSKFESFKGFEQLHPFMTDEQKRRLDEILITRPAALSLAKIQINFKSQLSAESIELHRKALLKEVENIISKTNINNILLEKLKAEKIKEINEAAAKTISKIKVEHPQVNTGMIEKEDKIIEKPQQLEKLINDELRQRQAEEQPYREAEAAQQQLEDAQSPFSNISMMVLGGFIAAAGIAAVAIAFAVLNASTFGVAGLVVGIVGTAAVLSGIGLFASGAYKNRQESSNESLNYSGNFAIQ